MEHFSANRASVQDGVDTFLCRYACTERSRRISIQRSAYRTTHRHTSRSSASGILRDPDISEFGKDLVQRVADQAGAPLRRRTLVHLRLRLFTKYGLQLPHG